MKGYPQTSKSDLRNLDRKLGMFAHICNSGETEAGRVPLQDQLGLHSAVPSQTKPEMFRKARLILYAMNLSVLMCLSNRMN